MKSVTLDTILTEIKSLRREVTLFMPSESVNDFSNKREIVTALKNARG
jgi:hypothetical protein